MGQQTKTNQARALRKRNVPAEALLWKVVRNRALSGFKFRRQHPIGPYIADFACLECKLVIEADGMTHLSRRSHDAKRTSFLEAEGWHVQRFWSTEVYDELDAIKESIYQLCVRRST